MCSSRVFCRPISPSSAGLGRRPDGGHQAATAACSARSDCKPARSARAHQRRGALRRPDARPVTNKHSEKVCSMLCPMRATSIFVETRWKTHGPKKSSTLRVASLVSQVNFEHILTHLDEQGYPGYVGLEYKPYDGTLNSLAWAKELLNARHA
eukprot:6191286-Pleurochrysis_carterae.AAC.2